MVAVVPKSIDTKKVSVKLLTLRLQALVNLKFACRVLDGQRICLVLVEKTSSHQP